MDLDLGDLVLQICSKKFILREPELKIDHFVMSVGDSFTEIREFPATLESLVIVEDFPLLIETIEFERLREILPTKIDPPKPPEVLEVKESSTFTIPPIKYLATYHRIDIEQKNKCRKQAGLPEIQIKVRKCLNCGVSFESAGPRFCGDCHRNTEIYAGREIL